MWPNPQETADLLTFTGKILNGTLHFLCAVNSVIWEKSLKLLKLKSKTSISECMNEYNEWFALTPWKLVTNYFTRKLE